jgi:hypothetical protein
MRHEDRIGQSAWDYGTVVIIMIATFAVSPGNARVYGEELLSAPAAGTILDRFTLTGDWWGVRDTLSAHGVSLKIRTGKKVGRIRLFACFSPSLVRF